MSDIVEESDSDGTTYHAKVQYQYVVNDVRYTADDVNFGQYGSSNPDHAREIVARYTVGDIVAVHYDPENPETAVLEPGVTWSSYFVLGAGFMFMLFPIIYFLFIVARQISWS